MVWNHEGFNFRCGWFHSHVCYMKYSVNAGRIPSVVKIVNFVRQARAKDQICLMVVI